MKLIPRAKLLNFPSRMLLNRSENTTMQASNQTDEELINRLTLKANEVLFSKEFVDDQTYPYFKRQNNEIVVHTVFSKLFEGNVLLIPDNVAKYVFTKIIGYDAYFLCPVIIVRNSHYQVVDLVKYRPLREGYTGPKYLQEKAINKPFRRGKFFLYVFQIEMEHLILKEKYCFVGEGIKNALNALSYSVPFISIESASNTNNPNLITYLENISKKGIELYGAFDGDHAGKKAFENINKQLHKPIINLIDFNTGIDFTEYCRKELI